MRCRREGLAKPTGRLRSPPSSLIYRNEKILVSLKFNTCDSRLAPAILGNVVNARIAAFSRCTSDRTVRLTDA
jgi:hypothetical protein